ncbi:response regulator [Fulvivirga sp. M361]|uniref:hybrid sensor histidine kinase/response regulator n=1 Tax=Fulvivirga sp. M361 TaxID=2594266 RepID=UPI00117B4FDB|nr:response regulator [Fulvivirga sp. M361]TRX59474.1 response regulator [Fulvivirga sp. M361]
MKKVLVIEDDVNIRESIVELLEMKEYDVMEAEDGDQGVEMAKLNRPDIILCDIMMPGKNGHEVLAVIRNEKGYSNVPFVFLTALSQKEDIRAGMNLGADDYLTKPFKARELYATIETRLAKQAERAEESTSAPDPFQQRVINENIVAPIQGLKSSSATLLEYFNDYAKDEIATFIQKLNASLGRVERATRNLVAAQAIELSNYDEKTMNGLITGVTSDGCRLIKSIIQETATNWDRLEDIFVKDIPEHTLNLPENTFRTIMSELLFNAFKYSDKGTLVTVEAACDNDRFVITIKDNGIGMDTALRDKLNNEELLHPLEGKYGLYIVKSLINRTGNEMKIESEKEKGTLIILTFQ